MPPALRGRVFRGSLAVQAGLLTPDQLRGAAWTRVFRDVYAHRDVRVDHLTRTRAAVLLLPGAVVSGVSAAELWGVPSSAADDPVEVSLPPTAGQVRIAGVRVRRRRLSECWTTRRSGLLVTTPEATAVDLAAGRDLDEAVVAVDRLIASGTTGIEAVRQLAAAASGPGSARVRRACALADGLAESPQETRLRLVLHRSGLPLPVAQHRVLDGGRFVARVDFGWPAQQVALEYDGLWHAEASQFRRDRVRLNRLTAARWRVVFVTAADMRQPAGVVARVAAELAR